MRYTKHNSLVSKQEDDSVCLQPEFVGDVSPQSLHSLSPGDSELHRGARGRGDGQTHGWLTGGDRSLAACSLAWGEATEPPLLLHSAVKGPNLNQILVASYNLGEYATVVLFLVVFLIRQRTV